MYFIDVEHVGAYKPRQISNMAHLMNIHRSPYRRIKRRQQLNVERFSSGSAGICIATICIFCTPTVESKTGGCVLRNLARAASFVHASSGVQKQTGHSVALRILQQLIKPGEYCRGLFVADPKRFLSFQ